MDPLAALLAHLAALTAGAGGIDAPNQRMPAEPAVLSAEAELTLRTVVPEPPGADIGWSPVGAVVEVPVQNQVRIERSITIRITPRPPRRLELDELPEQLPPRMVERRMGNCVPIRGISGVQVGRDNRLLLFMRDRRVVSLGLEKGCRARDFYSGFYVERSSDGQICVERDRLQSRSGANCELTRMRQLIEE